MKRLHAGQRLLVHFYGFSRKSMENPTFLDPRPDFYELTHTFCKPYHQSGRLFSSSMH
jgi:hypothetical protein